MIPKTPEEKLASRVWRQMMADKLKTGEFQEVEFPSGKTYAVRNPRPEWLMATNLLPHYLKGLAVEIVCREQKVQPKPAPAQSEDEKEEIQRGFLYMISMVYDGRFMEIENEADRNLVAEIAQGLGEFPNVYDLERFAKTELKSFAESSRLLPSATSAFQHLTGTVTMYDLDAAAGIYIQHARQVDRQHELDFLGACLGVKKATSAYG